MGKRKAKDELILETIQEKNPRCGALFRIIQIPETCNPRQGRMGKAQKTWGPLLPASTAAFWRDKAYDQVMPRLRGPVWWAREEESLINRDPEESCLTWKGDWGTGNANCKVHSLSNLACFTSYCFPPIASCFRGLTVCQDTARKNWECSAGRICHPANYTKFLLFFWSP